MSDPLQGFSGDLCMEVRRLPVCRGAEREAGKGTSMLSPVSDYKMRK